jgi:Family of unknown function (DUF6069)
VTPHQPGGANVEEDVMSTTNIHPTTQTNVTTRTSRPSLLRVAGAGVVAIVAGAAVLLAYGAIAVAIHGPMQAGDYGASSAAPINAGSFAFGVVFSSFFGVVLAVALARWAKHPARTFFRAAIVLTLVSLAAPMSASHTTEATRLVLAGGHIVAAVVVIPVIARALRSTRS